MNHSMSSESKVLMVMLTSSEEYNRGHEELVICLCLIKYVT